MNHAITTLLVEANKMRNHRKLISDDASIPESDKADLIVQMTSDILDCDNAVRRLMREEA